MKTLIFVFFCLTALISGTANGQWQWISPQPTGYNLRDISFINDNTGYIISDNSILFKTTNAANSWSKITELEYGNNWTEFMFMDEYTGYINYPDWTSGNLYRTTNGGVNWTSCFTTDNGLWDIDFINPSNGFAIAENVLFKTTNTGINWFVQYSFPSRITKLEFYDSEHGLAYANFDNKIWVTTNGGSNWNVGSSTIHAENIFYVDQNNVYVSDWVYNVFKSTDSGLNWVDKGVGGNIQYFENQLTGYSIYYHDFKRTTDGAVTWNTFVQSENLPTGKIAYEQNIFYSVGTGGYVVKSFDKGLNWELKTTSLIEKSHSLFFSDNNTGVIAGGDKIIKTNDGGNSWSLIMNLDTLDIQNLNSPDNLYLFAACKSGYFGRSSDFGNTWNFSYTGFPVDYTKTYFTDQNTGYLIKPGSDYFYRTQDGGISWQEKDQVPKLGDLSFTDNLNGYAMSYEVYNNNIYRTTDGGITWFTSYTFPQSSDRRKNLIFKNSETVYLSYLYENPFNSFKFIIYKSTNAGQTWVEAIRKQILSINSNEILNAIYNIHLVNDNVLIGQYGNNGIKSEDQGSTWRDIIYPYTTYINYFFPSNENGFIAGNNVIGKIENGGTVSINNISTINVPEKFHLYQNYPNPFNPSTNLEFGISELGFVSLKVYDALGKEVATIVNEVLSPGNYNYQFSTVNYQLPSGVYFYKLESGGFVETKRMVLLK